LPGPVAVLVVLAAPERRGAGQASTGPASVANRRGLSVIVSKLNGLRVARAIGLLPENINFAVKADLARTLLDKNSIRYDPSPSNIELATPEIADKVFKFTAMVQCYK
jgi:hypothetical protein